jgi:hypothetical protein
MARPTRDPRLLFWQDVAFCPAGLFEYPDQRILLIDPIGADQEGVELVILEDWPAKLIMANLAANAAEHRLAWSSGRAAGDPAFDRVTEWIRSTRALARDLPYGGDIRAEMERIAGRLEAIQNAPAQFTKKPPRGRVEEREHRFNRCLFVMDEIRKAARWTAPGFWYEGVGRLVGDSEDIRSSFDEDAITKRIQRFRANLPAAEMASVIVRDTIVEIMKFGLFVSDPATPRKELNIN